MLNCVYNLAVKKGCSEKTAHDLSCWADAAFDNLVMKPKDHMSLQFLTKVINRSIAKNSLKK